MTAASTEARETAERIVREYENECGPGPHAPLLPDLIALAIDTARRAAIEECARFSHEWLRSVSLDLADELQRRIRSLLTPAAAPEGGTT